MCSCCLCNGPPSTQPTALEMRNFSSKLPMPCKSVKEALTVLNLTLFFRRRCNSVQLSTQQTLSHKHTHARGGPRTRAAMGCSDARTREQDTMKRNRKSSEHRNPPRMVIHSEERSASAHSSTHDRVMRNRTVHRIRLWPGVTLLPASQYKPSETSERVESKASCRIQQPHGNRTRSDKKRKHVRLMFNGWL